VTGRRATGGQRMTQWLKKFERVIVGALIVMLALVVALAAVELGWILVVDIASPPVLLLEVRELLDIFGFFLLVLIGLEIIDTLKIYFDKGSIELKVIFTVALIAIGRKIIVLEPSDYDGAQLIGMAAIILALAAGYGVATGRFPRRDT
jgi:uncharacterized membrane protein (DUF373 family)